MSHELKHDREQTVRVESIAVVTGDYRPAMVVHALPAADGRPLNDFTLFDLDKGESGCKLSIAGKPTDRWALIRWASEAKGVTATLFISDRRYGHVIEARFKSGGRP